ncbi:MAG TPA: cold shock domain-containing protein [Pirellulaceae bacterium]|jgi:cold shock CspA family protein
MPVEAAWCNGPPLAKAVIVSQTTFMFYGTIKTIAPDRGFGFIAHEGGKDVYFHAVDIGDETFRRLTIYQPVKFEFAPRDKNENFAERKGPRAAKIELIDRLPGGVMDRPPQELAPHHHPNAKQRKATWKRRIDIQKKDTE